MVRELVSITDDEFQITFGLVASANALHRALARSPTVAEVRQALKRGLIDDDDIHALANDLLQAWMPGQLFPHDIALAALAVVLENRFTDFAAEYLHDLARLDLSELPKAARIARLCIHSRSRSSHNDSRQFLVSPARIPEFPWRLVQSNEESGVGETVHEFSFSEALCQS